jgi:hypothetical protein
MLIEHGNTFPTHKRYSSFCMTLPPSANLDKWCNMLLVWLWRFARTERDQVCESGLSYKSAHLNSLYLDYEHARMIPTAMTKKMAGLCTFRNWKTQDACGRSAPTVYWKGRWNRWWFPHADCKAFPSTYISSATPLTSPLHYQLPLQQVSLIQRRNAATMFSYIFPKLAAQHPRSASMPEAERYNVISQFIWYALSWFWNTRLQSAIDCRWVCGGFSRWRPCSQKFRRQYHHTRPIGTPKAHRDCYIRCETCWIVIMNCLQTSLMQSINSIVSLLHYKATAT